MNNLELLVLKDKWVCWNCRYFLADTPRKGFYYCFKRKRSLTDKKGWTDAYWNCPIGEAI